MARIKKYSPEQNLSSFQTLIVDDNPNSDYFRITEFKDTFTGGKNGFLIEGSEYLKETTEIKIEILDVDGNPIFYEPAKGIPEYYEGISSLIAVYIYNDTPIGLGKITILGELKQYDDNGVKRDIPNDWKGAYNVKWERTFQINKILANEDRVRFFKRPQINIDEINKPIFNNNANLVTQIGNVNGIPLTPTAGTSLSEFSLPTSYRLNVSSGNNWTGSIDGNRISFDNIDYNPIVLDVVSETEVIVSPPYAPNGIVAPFSNESYTTSFNYLEGVSDLATALTGSFAKISITDMKTVVGDAARVKVYRRSQSNLTDYEFVQEIQLESNELLRDIETTEANEISYGTFTQDVLSQYWMTSSNDISVELNTGFLYNSAKLNSTEGNHFLTTQSFSIQSGVEYTLDFNVKKGSVSPTNFLKATLSGSLNGTPKSQTIVNIPSSNAILQKQNFTENIIADDFDEAKLYFEVDGTDWYINNLSLKASQETSFSPDEITFIQQVPKTLQTETFDYRFEFYDINNNYIPVLVEDTKTFDGGNLNLFNKDITITPNNLYFSFDSASAPSNPLPPTTITFDVETTLVTGSITYTSGAYDEFGDLILSSEYVGGQYPGVLSGYDTLTPTLTVADFTGSRDDITVQYIRFTGEVEDVSDSVVITRTQDGKGGVSFEIRPYRGTIIKNKDEKTLEVQAIRIDGVNEIILRDNLPQNGFSDAKLRIQSGSEYILLSDAQSTGFIQGLTAGITGSGELDYNAVFDRTSITGQLPLYLMDGDTEEDILSTLILTDLQDGLGAGFVTFDAEQFNINPKEDTTFTPQTASLAGNFYLRGTNESPISGTLKVFPSMSINDALLPEYYMFFETGAFDSRILVTATNAQNETIDSGIPGDSVGYYTPIQSKQLTFNFTYVEDFTSESISVDKTIFVAPDGIGIEPVVVSIDPLTLNLNSNQQGEVYSYTPLDTTITAKQGKLDLIYTGSERPGTFYTESIDTTNIEYTTESFTNTTLSLTGFQNMTSSLVASVDYNLKIYPYYTSSFQLQTITQRITKGVDGSDAVEILIEPSVVSLQANENGTVADYSPANTDIVVKQGNLYLSYETSSLPGTYTVSATGSGIVVGNISASSQYDLDFGDETVHYTNFSELNVQSASVDYNFYVYPYSLTNGIAGVEETYIKKQVFSKSNDGTAARSVSLATTTDVVNFDGDGIVTSPLGSIFLTATPFNVTSSQAYYQFFRDGFAYSLVSTDNTFEIGSGDATSPGETATWTVQLRDGQSNSPIVATAEVTIAGIKAGADNYQVFLTNPSPSVGVEVDGTTTLDTTGTQITALKGTTELTHVSTYSEETLNLIGDPIGTIGEFSSSLYYVPPFITQPNIPNGNPASIDPITAWTTPQDNKSATLVYKVDIENGRATYFLSQSISTVFEGATGPGIVVRGEWTGSIDFLFSLEQQRRDAVIYRYDNGGEEETHFFATTNALNDNKRLPYTASSGFTDEPIYDGTQEQGDVDTFGWEYLGQQDMFVAAKIAIFEESFVENTINVGIPPDGNPNANIAIVGGTDEPYIAIGQTGTQGFRQDGIWMGMSNDISLPNGSQGTSGLLSLKSVENNGTYNSLEWDGDTLTIRGAIRQTAAGQIEASLRGNWTDATQYYINDSVVYNGQSWSSDSNHTSDIAGGVTTGPPGTGPWTASSGTGKTVSLSADTFVIEYDQDGNNPSPSSINLIASSSNFVDPYFKFTGGGLIFTDETTFTDGSDTNNDIVSSIDISSTTISDMPLQFRVGVADGGLSGQDQTELISDVINIFGVKPGADTTPQYMITPTSGGTQIKNNSGTIELQVQESSVSGLSNVSSGTIKLYKDDSSLLNASMSGITGDEYNPTITADAINGTLILELRDSSDDSVLDTIALLDVTDGLGGGSFISPNLKSTRTTSTNTFPITNTFTPEVLSATASFYDTSGTEYQGRVEITPSFSGGVDRMAVSTKAGDSEVVITAGDGDGGSVTLGGSSVATKDIVLTAVFTDPATGQTSTINETFYIISDGADGLDAITVINTNQAHTLPASDASVVSSFTNSGTTIKVFEGTNVLDYVTGTGTANAGEYNISVTQTPTSTMNTPSISGTGTDTATVADFTSMDNATDSVTITYSISGKRSNGEVFTSETTQTLTKAVAGSTAKTMRLSANSQTFRVAKDGTITPTTITFTANRQNISTATSFTTVPSPMSLGGSGDTATLTYTNFSQGGSHTSATITATADGLSDEITVVEVVEGSDALTVILSNETHNLPAASDGTVSSYVGSGTTITVFEGATQLNHDNGGDGGFDVVATGTNITAGTISDSGNNALVADHSNMTADLASIEYEIDITRLDGTTVTLFKTQSFSKAKSGTDGAAGEAAGVTYAGTWSDGIGKPYEGGTTYMGENTLKYVVRHNGEYYISKISHTPRGLYDDISGETFYSEDSSGTYVPDVVRKNLNWYQVAAGEGPITGLNPLTNPTEWQLIGSSITPGTWTDGWEAFGAQFTSVATDILFAEDVYANRTINIGSDASASAVIAINADSASGYQNPFISIGQAGNPGFGEDGIYMGYTEQTASLSILSDNGAKINIGGLNVDKEGMFFEETVELPPFTQVDSTRLRIVDTGSGFTWPPEIINFGAVDLTYYSAYPVVAYTSSFTIEIDEAFYEPSIIDWSIFYYSSSFEIPIGGPATKPSASIDVHGWRDDPVEWPEDAPIETWFVDWSIDKSKTIAGYNFTKDQAEGYSYFTLRTGTLLSEFGISDFAVNSLRGDGLYGNGAPFPTVGGQAEYDVNIVYGLNPTGSMPVLWIDNTEDDNQDIPWTTHGRVAYQIIDIVNSTTPSNSTGYDTFVLGQRVYPSVSGDAFEDDFFQFETDYSVASAQNGTALPSATVAIRTSLFKNIQLSWAYFEEDDSGNYTGTELGIGFLQGDPIQVESIRIHSSGSNGNARPYLSMGQITQSYDENGVYLGYEAGSDIPRLSLQSTLGSLKWDGEILKINGRIEGGGVFGTASVVEGSEIRVGETSPGSGEYNFTVSTEGNVIAESAEVRGIIEATSGKIGDWRIDADTQALRDDNNEIVFDPNIPEIGLYDTGSGTKTVRITPTIELAPPNASGVTVTNMASLSNYTSVTSTTTSFPPSYGSFTTAANSDAFTGVENGVVQLTFQLPTLGMLSTGTSAVNVITSAPNYNATSNGQVHGRELSARGSTGYEVWAELVGSDGTTVLQSQRLMTVTAFSSYEFNDVYIAGESAGGGGGLSFYSVTGDTLIQLADGTSKRADAIDGNDWLLVWDEKENELVPHQIAAKKERWVNEYYIVKTKEREVKVSDTHGFYLDNDTEIKVEDLVIGETEIYIYNDSGELVKSLVTDVEHIQLIDLDVHVVSFSTPPHKNYISDGILSHNFVSYPWEQQTPTIFDAVSGLFPGQTISRNFNFTQGNSSNYYLRYKWRGVATSGQYWNTAANGTETVQYQLQTSNATYATGISNITNNDPQILVPTNITEITGKGLQVLSGQNQYVRIERGESSGDILKTAGGNFEFGAPGQTTTTYKIYPAEDNRHDLGTSSDKWRYVYSNNTLQTSDRAKKKNIISSDLGLSFINSLNPVKYHWLNDENTSPYHYGLIAQDVDEVVSKDIAAIITEDSGSWNMAYNELISPMIKAIQQLSEKVDELQTQISGSNS